MYSEKIFLYHIYKNLNLKYLQYKILMECVTEIWRVDAWSKTKLCTVIKQCYNHKDVDMGIIMETFLTMNVKQWKNLLLKHHVYLIFLGPIRWFYENNHGKKSESFKLASNRTKKKKLRIYMHMAPIFSWYQFFPAKMLKIISLVNMIKQTFTT